MHAAHELNGPTFAHAILTTDELIAALPSASSPLMAAANPVPAGFAERFAEVNGVRLHYLIGGKGSPVVLLHGYAETSHMWHPLMPLLAERHTVIVPDLRGAGGSAKPESGYDKKNMAVDIHELTSSLGFDRVQHRRPRHRIDGGLRLRRAVPAGHRARRADGRVSAGHRQLEGRLAAARSVALPLLRRSAAGAGQGRERTYFEHFWNDFAADPKHSVPEADRRIYAQAYAQPGGMRAGFEYFRNFERDAQDFAQMGTTPLTMPVLVLTGEKASGNFLIEQAKLVASDVQGQVIPGSGHWLMEEAPADGDSCDHRFYQMILEDKQSTDERTTG